MPSESASRSPWASTDDHAAADVGGGDVDEPVAVAAVAGAEQVGERGGDDVGLPARLRAHLRVDAVGDARRERDLERDDRQHEHVAHGQQQPRAEAYSSSPSGAAKRKPTPRTVWM